MDLKRPKKTMQSCQTYEESGRHGENKSKRPRTDDDEREAQEFFALVENIQALKKLMNSVPEGNNCANLINGRSPWKPVLQWEDFSNLPPKRSPCAQMGMSCFTQEGISCGVSREADNECEKYMGGKSFDLNEEPTSEQPVTRSLNLFS
ncbi:protein NEGATIVE REGULATOR OF RESISTANCE-like [Cryptomeria japonica]|uniref:protein NEGATIVE REGULATOR OF RESISTANCE-like n=1 Tax=Cryptomeria japonica TaxID=3369 RepID=UPI0027D9F078|nr:protein NEGATIVE REGULATOR OF RESISTANCE-like [Cryptomeria japonica]XP_059076166.1 protein NEGATIVE REGULATOR OF RESISTANCE-like [Cryptomeria japonica]